MKAKLIATHAMKWIVYVLAPLDDFAETFCPFFFGRPRVSRKNRDIALMVIRRRFRDAPIQADQIVHISPGPVIRNDRTTILLRRGIFLLSSADILEGIAGGIGILPADNQKSCGS
jgi:hypothetical protein